ncbi:MAG: FAD-dependent oxidoreductase, partial [Gammaproteobacteria bacterium]|nr:FAD-dependent oxidoreductase [Gammaproteobacteria bacterium]
MKINSKLIIVAIFGLALLAYFALDLEQYLSLDSLKQHQESLSQWVQSHYVQALFGFFILYVAAASLSLPGATILTLLAGAIFGLGTGFVLVSFASSIGATLAMLVSRHLLRDTVQNKLGDKLSAIERGIEKDGAFYLLSLRLVPIVPFFAINLLFGLTQFKAKTFYWVSQLGMLPGTLVYVNAGTALSQLESVGDVASPSLFLSLAALAALPWVGRWINAKIQARKIYQGYDKPKQFDQNMVVIGAGAGGLVSAYIAAAVKAKVMLIEKHQMGGDCLNTGCVPSKALLAAAHSVRRAEHAKQYGVSFQSPNIDFEAVMSHVKASIRAIEPNDSPERYRSLGVEVELGEAKVIDPWRVEVNGKTITTENIVLATGGRPRMPSIEGVELAHVYNSDTIWSLERLPKHLVVYGGGPIGCELAQAFRLLGSRVTMVVQSTQLLAREEPEAAKSVETALREDGIETQLSTSIERITDDQVILDTGDALAADAVLIAIGREAIAPKNMGLDALGILDSRGAIVSNAKLQTAIPNVFVVGDAAGGP